MFDAYKSKFSSTIFKLHVDTYNFVDYNNKCTPGCGADGSARGLGP